MNVFKILKILKIKITYLSSLVSVSQNTFYLKSYRFVIDVNIYKIRVLIIILFIRRLNVQINFYKISFNRFSVAVGDFV